MDLMQSDLITRNEAGVAEGRPSTSGEATASNNWTLPRKLRSCIYEMVLRVPHPIYLFQETDDLVEAFAPEKPAQWHALLHVSKKINSEASAVLYRTNKFSLLEMSPKEVVLLRHFLNGIGPRNASSISYFCVSFPYIESRPENCQIRADSAEMLAVLEEKCTGLKTLELVIHSKNCGWFTCDNANTTQYVLKMLSHIDVKLKGIVSIEQVCIRVHSGALQFSISDHMRHLGWKVLA